jgi:prepilin-type N-terminal cleavage/methylation domain-containing protein
MNKKGVTLIELIVVMVIIGIGATLMVPGIGQWLPNYRLRSATRDIVSTMRTAQMKAVSTNTTYGVAFAANSFQLYQGTVAEGAVNNLPTGVQFENNTFPVNATLGKQYAQFNTDSTCSAGGVTLKNNKGKKIITTSAATGRVRIE